MSRPSLVVFVRHAESLRNKVRKGNIYFEGEEDRSILQGIPDDKIDLSTRGAEQAIATGPFIREKYGLFDYVYHSGYNRTIQTMNGILAAYPQDEVERMKIRMNPFIYERHSGYAYDMTAEEAEGFFPWLQGYWQTFGGFFAQPPGGESLAQVVQRAYIFINMLFRDRIDQKVLVNLHGGTLRCIRFILERWDFEEVKSWPPGQSPKNCGLTVYRNNLTDKRLELQEYNTVYWK